MGRGAQFAIVLPYGSKKNSAFAQPRRTVFIFMLPSKVKQEKACVNNINSPGKVRTPTTVHAAL